MCIGGGLTARPVGAAQTCTCLSGRIPPAEPRPPAPSRCSAKLCLSFHIRPSSYRRSSRRRQWSSSVEHGALLDVLRRGLGKMGSALAFWTAAEISAGIRLSWCCRAGGPSWSLRDLWRGVLISLWTEGILNGSAFAHVPDGPGTFHVIPVKSGQIL